MLRSCGEHLLDRRGSVEKTPDYEAARKKSKPSIVIAAPPRLTPVHISQKLPTRLNVSIAALPDLCPAYQSSRLWTLVKGSGGIFKTA
jgi:hypothetical protein